LRRECIGGGMVVKAPANVVVLIVSAARDVVICDSTLAMKSVHVIEAATKTAFGHYCFDDKGSSQPYVRFWPKADIS
jgi:hypothetical protein